MPPPEAKPTYATLHATVVAINPDQVGGGLSTGSARQLGRFGVAAQNDT